MNAVKLLPVILLIFIFGIDRTNAQTSFTFNLLPEETYPGYVFHWSLSQPLDGAGPGEVKWDISVDTVSWLEALIPSSFISQNCTDIIPGIIELKGTSEPGFFSIFFPDLWAPPASTLSIQLNVTETPPIDSVINLNGTVGEPIEIPFELFYDFNTNPFGCSESVWFPEDSIQRQWFWTQPDIDWINFENDTLAIEYGDTLSKTFTIQADSVATYSGILTHYREYRGIPKRYQINLNVELPTNVKTQYKEKASFLIYPNPSQGQSQLQIIGHQNDAIGIHLLNLNGRRISGPLTVEGKQTSQTLELPNLDKGIYFLRIHSIENGYLKTLKWVVQ